MTRCSHPDCEREAVGNEQRQTATMPAPGFYPYCAQHLPTPDLARLLDTDVYANGSREECERVDQLRDELVHRLSLSDLYEACQTDYDYQCLDHLIDRALEVLVAS